MVEWESLPEDIRHDVTRLGQRDARAFIHQPIPALGGNSIADALDEPDGERRVRECLLRAIGKFG